MAFLGKGPRDAECHATGEDRHLVERIRVRKHGGEHRVAALVVRGGLALLGREHHALAARAHDHAVTCVLEVDPLDDRRSAAHCEKGGLVDEVREVGAAHSRGGLGHRLEVDVGSHALVARVNLEDCEALLVLGKWHDDLSVEATRTQQCRVEDVGTVRRGEDHDPCAGLEAVHFGQHLVQGLLALVVTTTETGTALASDRVDLVDEDDRLAHLACLLEEVTNAARADADEHLHEVRTGDRQEADSGFTGHGTGKERLSRAGRAHQQDALRHACTDLLEALGHAQEVDDLLDLQLHAVVTGDVGERGRRLVGLVRLRLAAPDRHDVPGLTHRAALHPHEETDDQQERQQDRDQARDPVRLRCHVVVVDAHLLQQFFVGVGERARPGGDELAAVVERPGDRVCRVVDGDLGDVAAAHLFEELGVAELLAGGSRHDRRGERDHHQRGDDHPDRPARHRWALRVCSGAVALWVTTSRGATAGETRTALR